MSTEKGRMFTEQARMSTEKGRMFTGRNQNWG
jgi:hypothetical protein